MTQAVIIGRFMPPHTGHLALWEAALALEDRLHILIEDRVDDAIPATLRRDWIAAMCPAAILHLCDGPMPQSPKETPDFATRWADRIGQLIDGPVDRVVGSEAYCVGLADALGAAYTVLDPMRVAFPISSTRIRTNPYAVWSFVPPVVRPHYQKRLTLVGPESVGKSHLTRLLAERFGGPFVPEYGRPFEKYRREGPYAAEELHEIARGHAAHRQAIARQAGPILFEDTDELLTSVWAEMLLDRSLPDLEARIVLPDLYLLLDPDVPWAEDPIRYFARDEARKTFYDLIRRKLDAHGATYRIVSGDWAAREAQGIATVEEMLASPARHAEAASPRTPNP
ncbi:AAA family ATPase [Oceanomicrobium pacificus]|uniref:AAA family ATPase n=1 Tax=Oceanomicrobium pacificus TaxID=2692916 RepID=A0A6B0TQA9_9RHOB|nr:AAA family ATPase [Oceanomicrobium pacificus]MXU66860.1 AAA family ATPase [Oceanomicrobium pacificus]